MPVPSKAHAKEILRRFLDRIPMFRVFPEDSQEFTKWQKDTRVAIENIFGQDSRQVNEFGGIRYIPGVILFGGNNDSIIREAYIRGLEKAEDILQSMIDEIEEYWPDGPVQNPVPTPQIQKPTNTTQVFIIHGRDTGTLAIVARFLESLDIQPVILQEQPDRSRTIIEKFEEYAQVNFALALFTPDDFGGLEGDDPQSRARQNVIFEFGYFIGKYGRDRVRALVKGNIEIPSDYSGVLNIPLDDFDGWKMRLAKELEVAGFNVDLNCLLRKDGAG